MITRCPACGRQARRAECDDGETRLLELAECGPGRYALWSADGAKLPYPDVLAGRGHFTHTCPTGRRPRPGRSRQAPEGQPQLF